ncbi:hypothetical protein PHSC3_000241 [Chlamydiales bacterium STE3]|nr:hypothetical protein PHSC3_000241 [Chlamydiales bacterium STE3]
MAEIKLLPRILGLLQILITLLVFKQNQPQIHYRCIKCSLQMPKCKKFHLKKIFISLNLFFHK